MKSIQVTISGEHINDKQKHIMSTNLVPTLPSIHKQDNVHRSSWPLVIGLLGKEYNDEISLVLNINNKTKDKCMLQMYGCREFNSNYTML